VNAQYLTTGEVALRLGVSSRRVIQLADEGRLAHQRVGKGMRLFDPDAVEAFAADREAGAAA
jgi:excisionase family DNA binding protein